jgi:hypothetical protein
MAAARTRFNSILPCAYVTGNGYWVRLRMFYDTRHASAVGVERGRRQ